MSFTHIRKSMIWVVSSRNNNGELSILVDAIHQLDLMADLVDLALVDAVPIDPEIPKVQLQSSGNGILNGARQIEW